MMPPAYVRSADEHHVAIVFQVYKPALTAPRQPLPRPFRDAAQYRSCYAYMGVSGGALWTRGLVVEVAMGCRTELATVHIAHVLQKLHFLQFSIFVII